MKKSIGLILFIAHVIGCNSAVIGYMVGAANNDSGKIIRQLQHHTKIQRQSNVPNGMMSSKSSEIPSK